MKLKEKYIYYNPIQKGYYLAISTDDEMIYGIRGVYATTSQLEDWINQDGSDICFKIGDILIFKDYIRNYFLDEAELKSFEPIKELTEAEFNIIETLTYSDYPFPPTVIDVDRLKDNTDVSVIIFAIKRREEKIAELKNEIFNLEKDLYKTIYLE